MDNLFLLGGVVAVAAVVFVYLRFSKGAAGATALALALLLSYFRGRVGAKQEAEVDVLKERVRNDEVRNERAGAADAAADAVRVDNATGGLRNNDGFRRD